MHLTHDRESDAAYIYLSGNQIARTEERGDALRLDFDKVGEIVGVEILNVSRGVDLGGIPAYLEARVARLLEEHRFRVLTH